jgi:hypothetical protein
LEECGCCWWEEGGDVEENWESGEGEEGFLLREMLVGVYDLRKEDVYFVGFCLSSIVVYECFYEDFLFFFVQIFGLGIRVLIC